MSHVRTSASDRFRKDLDDKKISTRKPNICKACSKKVTVVDRTSVSGEIYHRKCFQCVVCKQNLRPGSYTFNEEKNGYSCVHHIKPSLRLQNSKNKQNKSKGVSSPVEIKKPENNSFSNEIRVKKKIIPIETDLKLTDFLTDEDDDISDCSDHDEKEGNCKIKFDQLETEVNNKHFDNNRADSEGFPLCFSPEKHTIEKEVELNVPATNQIDSSHCASDTLFTDSKQGEKSHLMETTDVEGESTPLAKRVPWGCGSPCSSSSGMTPELGMTGRHDSSESLDSGLFEDSSQTLEKPSNTPLIGDDADSVDESANTLEIVQNPLFLLDAMETYQAVEASYRTSHDDTVRPTNFDEDSLNGDGVASIDQDSGDHMKEQLSRSFDGISISDPTESIASGSSRVDGASSLDSSSYMLTYLDQSVVAVDDYLSNASPNGRNAEGFDFTFNSGFYEENPFINRRSSEDNFEKGKLRLSSMLGAASRQRADEFSSTRRFSSGLSREPPPFSIGANAHLYPKIDPASSIPEHQIYVELHSLDAAQMQLASKGSDIEDRLRHTKRDGISKSTEIELMGQWLELVRAKNNIVRRETELMHLLRQRELEELQSDIETRLRMIYARSADTKTKEDALEEEELLASLLDVVESRNKIVELLEQDRVKEEMEDKERENLVLPSSLKAMSQAAESHWCFSNSWKESLKKPQWYAKFRKYMSQSGANSDST